MTTNSLRSLLAAINDPFVGVCQSLRVSANTLSLCSLAFAALAGIAYCLSAGNRLALAIALLCVLLNAFLDGLDGAVARRTGTNSSLGDFMDHVIDRYADVFIVCGILLGGYLRADLGVVVIAGVLLVSYLGTQAQAVGVGRVYGGVMGRADRLIVVLLATCVNLAYPAEIGVPGVSFTVLGWALLLIGALSHVTALQRIWYTRQALLDPKNNKK
jgi:CDP-diacylglycerol--glycerol-3-phosphate 3-phosphatidyltransferase/archaetidylinositol phosphate synthase